ncbi:MAG: hypothetical protein EBR88_01335 [Betaproteobacteria bacterium]|nr:hypothetical protein [Betaproteobacteria bacterium]
MTTETSKKRPTMVAFTVSGEGDDAQWTEIGAVWASSSGKSQTLVLRAGPLSNRIVLMPYKARPKTQPAEAGEGGAQ